MTASNIQVTQGSGTRLATNSYTEGGVTVHDEKFILGEPYLATYVARANTVSGATSADHLMQLMAGASLNVRIRRIRVRQQAAASAVGATVIEVLRLTTAGTGGTTVTPSKLENADAASGGTAMTLPTAKGTESTILWDDGFWAGTAAIPVRDTVEWVQLPSSKPIVIAAGTSNGIAIKITTGLASLSVTVDVEFAETSF